MPRVAEVFVPYAPVLPKVTVERYRKSLPSLIANQEYMKDGVRQFKALQATLTALPHNEPIPKDFYAFAMGIGYVSAPPTPAHLLSTVSDRIHDTNSHIATAVRSIRVAQDAIAKADVPVEGRTINRGQLCDQLAGLGIPRDSVKLLEQSTSVRLKWTFSGLHVTPSRNPWRAIQAGQRPAIPLNDIDCELELAPENRGFARFSVSLPVKYGWRFYRNNRCAPHIMADGAACLGDFAGPIAELLNTLDVAGAIEIYKLFFEQADHNDPAGGTWHYPLNISHWHALPNDLIAINNSRRPEYSSDPYCVETARHDGITHLTHYFVAFLGDQIKMLLTDADGNIKPYDIANYYGLLFRESPENIARLVNLPFIPSPTEYEQLVALYSSTGSQWQPLKSPREEEEYEEEEYEEEEYEEEEYEEEEYEEEEYEEDQREAEVEPAVPEPSHDADGRRIYTTLEEALTA